MKKFDSKLISFDTQIKSVEDEGDQLKIAGYASTESKDRVADVILATAWTKSNGLKNFKKNPILLFNHNYNQPIGKITEVETDSKGLKIKAVISESAGNIRGLIKDGTLGTFSVGFMIKDADYNRADDGLIIKDAELLEVSVVSVPCNQDATFSVAKSFENSEDFIEFKKQFDTTGDEPGDAEASRTPRKMNEDEIKALLENATAKGAESALAAFRQEEATRKAAAEAAEAAKKALDDQVNSAVATATAAVISTAEERINAELEKRFADTETSLTEKISGLETELQEKSAELTALTHSKGRFSDRNENNSDWRKAFSGDIETAYMLGRVTSKGYETDFAKQLLEKVNAHSSVTVSSADFEQEVSLNIERDIQLELILAPMFREIQMNSANMIIPIMPDVGYAEITASAGSTDGVAPNGTLDTRGGSDRAGIPLTEITLQTVKMVAKSYLGNETEEDAIMPILPLIREAMIRQHTRGVENLILLAGHADGAYSGLTAAQGLLKYASTNSRDTNTGTVGTLPALTAAKLLELRKNMGKYGLRATDIIYVVSMTGYFELLEDPEFQDFNLVNQLATKISGEVGQVFGSPVVVCDEFPAAAAGKYYALALNKRNFVIPRLRGVTVESEYSVEDQHRVLVTTQRLGFKEIIPNAKSVFAYKYPAAS